MNNKHLSLIAMICGGLGLFGWLIPVINHWFIVLPLAIAGIVVGSKARTAALASGEPTGMATAGRVMGIIGLVVVGLIVLVAVVLLAVGASMMGDLLGDLLGQVMGALQ